MLLMSCRLLITMTMLRMLVVLMIRRWWWWWWWSDCMTY